MEEPEPEVGQQTVAYREDTRKTKNTSFSLYEGDYELLDYIREQLGCGRSEAARAAIRAFASQLATIQRGRS